ncbi:MAG: DUF1697 domain-containing protein [Streptosporangiales bacterium]|nr:DUF1697 domain-containing protein [Streptosporangiales bacterium]
MRYVALLRGINVGGKNKVAMADLRELLAGLGYTAVTTHLNSGNAVLTAPESETIPSDIAGEIRDRLGLDLTVMVRTGPRMREVVREVPVEVTDPAKFTVAFLSAPLPTGLLASLDLTPYAPDVIHPGERELYIEFPNGLGRSKLGPALERLIGVPATVRNWNTVTRLADLAEQE